MEKRFSKEPPKILIVDKCKEEAIRLSRLFESSFERPELLITGLGKKGIELTKTENPDVIILDPKLPDMSVLEFLKSIRSFSKCPVIIITTMAKVSYTKAIQAQIDDCDAKSSFRPRLLEKLRAFS